MSQNLSSRVSLYEAQFATSRDLLDLPPPADGAYQGRRRLLRVAQCPAVGRRCRTPALPIFLPSQDAPDYLEILETAENSDRLSRVEWPVRSS